MKHALIISLLLFHSCLSKAESQLRPPEEKPNIIFILIDDLGKEWISCYGGEGIKTPNIDKLAQSGMIFHHAYSMPQCTPSRACFLTGQYPWRNGWVNHWDSPRWGEAYYDWTLNPSIARTLKVAGYKTAIAGKWQLNDFRTQPKALEKHGFDDWCMWTGGEGSTDKSHTNKSEQRYWDPYIFTRAGAKTYTGQFGPDIYNQFLLDFIEKHKQSPFFAYYPMALTHLPLTHTPLHPEAKTKNEQFTAMVLYADHLLGKLVSHLDHLGIRKNTIIVWTTDNGTTGAFSNRRNQRLIKGGKALTTENGINAPFIVNAPGLVPEKTESNSLVDFTDMHTTFADIAGGKMDPQYSYDGHSLKEVFFGRKKLSDRKWILSMGCKPARMTDQGVENVYAYRDRVIRENRFKLFIGTDRKPLKLIDLKNDPEEKNDLTKKAEHAEPLQRLIKAANTLPKVDADPNYRRNQTMQKWWTQPTHHSKAHKIGASSE